MKPTAPTAFQVIRPQSLGFVLRYGGVPNDEMVRRIEATGRPVSRYAKDVIARFEHKPREKEVRVTAPLLSGWFDECPTTDAIYAAAKSRRLVELHPSAGLHLALLYAEQPKGEWIQIGHEPIPVPSRGGPPLVLAVGHRDDGRYLDGNYADPGRTWSLAYRWAFGVPAGQASDPQVP